MEDSKMINVRCRTNGTTGYVIEDGTQRITRFWTMGEVKSVSFGELKKLSWTEGGPELIKNFLVVEDIEALKELELGIDIKEQPEYLYTEEQIRKLLFEGTLDELKDFLDWSPEGGIDLAKNIAITEQLPDTRKRKIISEATGFNIDTAIQINEMANAENEGGTAQAEPAKKRRAAIPTTAAPEKPSRRTQYKIVE